VSRLIGFSLKEGKSRRSWRELVGYGIEDLMIHLEERFDDKMTWKNYGSYWHIDHIRPKNLFHYITPKDKEFKECWALNNLTPLFTPANK